nr:unnamed protein product [Callosobruchus chinensis]
MVHLNTVPLDRKWVSSSATACTVIVISTIGPIGSSVLGYSCKFLGSSALQILNNRRHGCICTVQNGQLYRDRELERCEYLRSRASNHGITKRAKPKPNR